MRPIRLYWSGRTVPNFGDALSPIIVEYLSGRPVSFASIKRCQLIAVGSIIHKIAIRWPRWLSGSLRPIKVWGSGSLREAGLLPTTGDQIYAVRGARTRDVMRLPIDTPLGDPGTLLARMIDAHRIPKRHRWGIIPHCGDRADPALSRITGANNATIIDVTDPSPLNVARRIASCDFVASSSLHGLIAADAFGIPNVHLPLGDRVIGGMWKFGDYATSVGRNLKSVGTFDDLLSLERVASHADPQAVSSVCDALEYAFKQMDIA